MLSLEALRMLDYQLWLRAGALAAERLHCFQSTVSRNNAQSLELFGLVGRDAITTADLAAFPSLALPSGRAVCA